MFECQKSTFIHPLVWGRIKLNDINIDSTECHKMVEVLLLDNCITIKNENTNECHACDIVVLIKQLHHNIIDIIVNKHLTTSTI